MARSSLRSCARAAPLMRAQRAGAKELLGLQGAKQLQRSAPTARKPSRAFTHQAAGDAPTNLTPTFIQQRTAFLEASMASLRTRAATLTATVSSLVTQRNDFLTNLQGTQQSVNALFTTPSSRTTTAAARALAAVQAHAGTNTPT